MAEAPSVPTFAVVLLAGLTVFGLAFVASETEGFGLQEPRDSMVVFQDSFGKLGEATRDFRTVDAGTFTVGEGRGDILALRRRRAELRNSPLSGNRVKVDYNATSPRTGRVTFEVLGRDGPGAVFVKVNGKKVFQEKLVADGTPEVTIPRENLHPGVNRIVVGATKGGISSSTTYTVEDLEIRVNDRKFHDYSDAFQVFDHELDCFASGSLSFDVAPGAVSSKPLRVSVNDNNVYTLTRVRGAEKVKITPQNADLAPGFNTLRFSTEGSARYTVRNAGVTLRHIGTVSPGTVSRSFGINDSALSFVTDDSTDTRLVFDYQALMPCRRGMVVNLNGDTHNLTPGNGENSIDVDDGNLTSSNSLRITSNSSYRISDIKLVAERVE